MESAEVNVRHIWKNMFKKIPVCSFPFWSNISTFESKSDKISEI